MVRVEEAAAQDAASELHLDNPLRELAVATAPGVGRGVNDRLDP